MTKNNKTYLLGKNIHKSLSPEIYKRLLGVDYKINNIKSDGDFVNFLENRNYYFCNITMPYKTIAVDCLDIKSEIVKKTGVCNLVINKNGVLKGFNTDVYGFEMLLKKHKINVENKNVLILGNGATSKTVKYVLESKQAKNIYIACRHIKNEGEFLFNDAPTENINIIVNTTPIGKLPSDRKLVAMKKYKKLETFIDLNYNLYRSPMMIDAKDAGKGAIGGIDMLIYQAAMTAQIAYNRLNLEFVLNELKSSILLSKTNIILTGLPTSGKTELCKKLEKLLNNEKGSAFFDTDKIIEDSLKKSISKIFEEKGEIYFREIEKQAVETVSTFKGAVISTGGGTLLNYINYKKLSTNGFIVYLKKTNFEDFADDGKRPLVKTKDDLYRLYKERNPIYEMRSDFSVISSNIEPESFIMEVCDAIVNS